MPERYPVRIVMVGTTHPGNIGAAARAMKTMSLTDLCLVAPKHFPHHDASAMASGADDILDHARVVPTIEEAVADAGLVIGMTARTRKLSCEFIDPRRCAEMALEESPKHPVVLLFGREHAGLTNEELGLCNFAVHIPTNPDFSSLNVASAIQIMCYQLMCCSVDMLHQQSDSESVAYVGREPMERLYSHIESTLVDIGFLDPANPKKLMPRLRRFFNRARLDENEMNIWRGIFAAIDRHTEK